MRDSISAGDSITVFDIVQYHYCPRKVYFLRVMEVPASIRRKMEYGRNIHEKEERRMTERELVYGFRHDEVAEIIQDLQIDAEEIGLRGKLDVALKLENGEMIPVDTKYTDEVIIQRQYLKQLFAYALLLEKQFKLNVIRGILYFSKQKETRMIDISYENKQSILRDISQIRDMFSNESLPRGAPPEKCGYCEVKKYCI